MNEVRLTMLASALALTAACSQQPESDVSDSPNSALGTGRVATVNGTPVPESVFRLYALNGLQKSADDLTEEERALVIDDLVRLRVLADEAEAQGLLEERTIAAELELQRLQQVARTMALRYLEENPATEAELRAAYEENLDELRGTQYKARHILLETEQDAQAIIDELDGGADFATLARERSTGPTAPQGGDLGWFSADSMVEPFANAVREMEPDSYSQTPVLTRFGWHVILVEDRQDQQAPGLDAVRNDMRTAVERQKLEDFVMSLRNSAEVVVE